MMALPPILVTAWDGALEAGEASVHVCVDQMPKSSNNIFARAEQCRMPSNQPGQAGNTDVKIEMKL